MTGRNPSLFRKKKVEQLKKLVQSGDLEKIEKELQKKYPFLTIRWINSNYYLVRAYQREMR